MTVQFDTRKYQFSHGAQPRGHGRWGFCAADKYAQVNYLQYVQWFTGTYGAAKRDAARFFAAAGVASVVVCE